MKGPGLRQALLCLGTFALLMAAGGVAFVASGLYNVAATERHFAVTELVIKAALRRSIAARRQEMPPPDLRDQGLAELGARHFLTGCAPCHGTPDAIERPVVEAMYPSPPLLIDVAQKWTTRDLFWIVKHGIKMTGMPAWPGKGREDEPWAVVAFLLRLPEMSAGEFRRLTAIDDPSSSRLAFAADAASGDDQLIAFCDSCHQTEGQGPLHPLVPELRGQKAAYLLRTLQDYQKDRRQSGMMEPIAARLDDRQLRLVADHYASRAPPPPAAAPVDPRSRERGAELAAQGAPARQLPACLACHGASSSRAFPRIAGLSSAYLEGQLRQFQAGHRGPSAYGVVMATIARRMSPAEIEDAAAYFSASGALSAEGDRQ